MITPFDVTIIVPTLNCRSTLGVTLESLLPLVRAGAELIVVDSFSTDGTAELGRALASRWLSVPPGNMYSAINAGMRVARGSWLSYLNADDILFPETVRSAVQWVPDGVDLFYSGTVEYLDLEGRFLHAFRMPMPCDILPLACDAINAVPPQGAFFRRQVFDQLGGFRETFRLAADFDFFIRARQRGFRFARFPRPALAGIRVHDGQYSHRETAAHQAEARRAVCENEVKASIGARLCAHLRFRLRNLDNYALRLIRISMICGGVTLSRCMDFPTRSSHQRSGPPDHPA